jgi:hypothetical protein
LGKGELTGASPTGTNGQMGGQDRRLDTVGDTKGG